MQNRIYKPNNWGGQTIVEQKSSKNYCRYFIDLKFFFKGTVTRKTTIFLQNQNINIILKKKTIDEKTGRHGSTIKEKRPKHFGKQNLSVTLKIEDLSILTWIDG